MSNYVEHNLCRGDNPASMFRHSIARIVNGKRNKRSVVADCGETIAYDDAYLFSMPDSEVNGRKAFDRCPDCRSGGAVEDDTDTVTEPVVSALERFAKGGLEAQLAADRALGEAIAATYNGDGPLGKPAKKSAPASSPSDAVIEWLSPGDLCASPHNHRKVFDQAKLEELAVSLTEKGMISPLTARPRPEGSKAKEPYELVVGERRWRASKIAKLARVPVIVRNLTDKEVLEIQLIENVQRVDVHPLEEADGYQALIDKHKYSVEQIVAKTGKSKAYVYARLKLTELAKAPRKAFLEDKLSPSIALMIARIPDPKLQAQATDEVLGLGGWQDYQGSGVRAHEIRTDEGKNEAVPLSVREAQVHLTRKYTLRLDQATFPTDDANLLPKAGACTTCSHRTGNQRELFSDVKSADVCTKPPCFEEKKAADWDRRAATAKSDGVRVLSEKEAKKVFEPYGAGTEVQSSSSYVDPKDKLPWDLDPSRKKTWGSLIGTASVAKAIALDGSGQARTLLERTSVLAIAKKSGKLKEVKAESRARSRGHDAYREKQKKREADTKRKRAVVELAGDHIVNAIEADDPDFTIDQWRWLANCTVDGVEAEDAKRVARRRGLEPPKDLRGQARAAVGKMFGKWIAEPTRKSGELAALVAELFAAHHAASMWQDGYGSNFKDAAAAFRFDPKKLHDQVVKAEKERVAAKKPAKKKGRKS